MKVIYLEWTDAAGSRGPYWGKKGREYKVLLMRTVGLLVSEDEDVVRVCQDSWESEPDEDGAVLVAYRDLQAIPKVVIKKRVDWDLDLVSEAEGAVACCEKAGLLGGLKPKSFYWGSDWLGT